MVSSAVLGYPRIGAKREVKKALESYWGGKISADELQKVAAATRKANWETLKSAGVDIIPSNDFTLYDHVLDASLTFNIIPPKHAAAGLSQLDLFFAIGRGHQKDGVDLPATEMRKWFDSNYHYVVPEVTKDTDFKLSSTKAVDEYKEALALGIETRPVVVGPVTLLLLSKVGREETDAAFEPIQVIDKLVPAYVELLKALKDAGAKAVQFDEPSLVMDVTHSLGPVYEKVYGAFAKEVPEVAVTVASYYGRIESNIDYLAKLPIAALSIDLDREPAQLDAVLEALKPTKTALSLGVVSGRNIWKNDFEASLALIKKAIAALGEDRVVVSSSSTLLHTPITLANEKKLSEEVKSWLAFATEKATEIAALAKLASGSSPDADALFEQNKKDIAARRAFETQSDDSVRKRLAAVTEKDLTRASPFSTRYPQQEKVYSLPTFPTTTIGSFPQTPEIRQARAKLNKKQISEEEYDNFIANEIKSVIDFQERIGLDILVHGEPERNDMVQYFGERLNGFVFTENAWVQSYGSRYVRPPIVVSDVSRPGPMTVRWSSYAQSLSKQPVKGMLTGPVTILNWSFPRADISREAQAKQIALALRDEVLDLEKAGIFAIQIDEPAIREGLPLRTVDTAAYLKWSVDSFRLATAGVKDTTQTHSHFCYSDFNSMFDSIIALDADVISIESSKSDLRLLEVFKRFNYPNAIGPGIYDIHSPRVPSEAEFKDKIAAMIKTIPDSKSKFFVNPDCGLKTRTWKEVDASLTNLVLAAKWARQQFA